MGTAWGETAGKLIAGAAQLIMRGGYNGFSYADLAERFAIRTASIHYHFPTKLSLVIAVVEQGREISQTQITVLEQETPLAIEQLRRYLGYWERNIKDQTAPFCVAGVLAAELPSLPSEMALSVQGHFSDLAQWLERVLVLGMKQGSMRIQGTPAIEAEAFIAGVYGAMLLARAFGDPQRSHSIVEAFIDRIRA